MRRINRRFSQFVHIFLPPARTPLDALRNFAALALFCVSAFLSANGGWWFMGTLSGALAFRFAGVAVGVVSSFGVSYADQIGLPEIKWVSLLISLSTSGLYIFYLSSEAASRTEEAWLAGRDMNAAAQMAVAPDEANRRLVAAEGDLAAHRSELAHVQSLQRGLANCRANTFCEAARTAQLFVGIDPDGLAGPETSAALDRRQEQRRADVDSALEARDAAHDALELIREITVSDEQVDRLAAARQSQREGGLSFLMTRPGVRAGPEPLDESSDEWERWVHNSAQRAMVVTVVVAVLFLGLIDVQSARYGSKRGGYDDQGGDGADGTVVIDIPQLPGGSGGDVFVEPRAAPPRPAVDLSNIDERLASVLKPGDDGSGVPSSALQQELEALERETTEFEELTEIDRIRRRRADLAQARERLETGEGVRPVGASPAPSDAPAPAPSTVHVTVSQPAVPAPPIKTELPMTDEERLQLQELARAEGAPQLCSGGRWVVAPNGLVLDRTAPNSRFSPIWRAYVEAQQQKRAAETRLAIDDGRQGV